MEIKICPKCGKDNESDSSNCGFCGAEIKTVEITKTTFRGIAKTSLKEMFAKDPEPVRLTNCPDCGKEISTKARACPGCGRPTDVAAEQEKKTRRNKRGNTQGMGCLIMLLSIFAVFLSPFLGGPLFFIGLVILIVGFFI